MVDVLTHNQTFASPQEALAHFGVKGMKWGVRKDNKPSGSKGKSPLKEAGSEDLGKVMDAFYAKKTSAELQSEGQKKLEAQANSSFPSKRQARRNEKAAGVDADVAKLDKQIGDMTRQRDALAPGARNFLKRSDLNSRLNQAEAEKAYLEKRSEQLREGRLTSTQKKALIGIGAAVAVGGLAYYGNKQISAISAQEHEANRRETSDLWNKMFGEDHEGAASSTSPIISDYGAGSFYVGLTNKKALSRPEFVIPEGTVFQRLSNHKEDSSEYGKVKGAYATFLPNDKKIYGSSSEFGGKAFTVNFKSKGPARVPSLPTVLAHLKQVQKSEYPNSPDMWTDSHVFAVYHGMAGGSWSDSTSMKLFSSLKTYGYSAIVDDMDAGYLGDLPVVFFGDAQPATSTPRSTRQRVRDASGIVKLSRKYS